MLKQSSVFSKQYSILVLCSLFFALCSAETYAQRDFSGDPEKFTSEMQGYFRDTKVDDDAKKALDKFKPIFEGGSFSEDQKRVIMATANKMGDKKMRANVEFKDYLQTLTYLSAVKPEHFDKMHETLDKLIVKKGRESSAYLNFTADFFNGNTLFLSNTTKWLLSSDNYSLEYDSVAKVIVHGKTDITCFSRGDRSAVYGTEGVYFPTKKLWRGKGGIVNWSRAGLDTTQIYAELSIYSIDCSKSDYKAEQVKFYHKQLFKNPLAGSLEDRLSTNNKPDNATYPKFDSYERDYSIKNFYKNVDFTGGFSMSGPKLYGTGNEDRKASITIYKGDTVILRTYSEAYVLQANEVNAYPTELSIYLGKDSIYHPGVEFRFHANDRKVSLFRQESGIGSASYSDSYHSMSFDVERLEWKIDEPFIEMGMIKGRFQQESRFESKNFYKQEKFRKVQGVMDYQPLTLLKTLSQNQKSKTITIASYANAVGLSKTDVLDFLRSLVTDGYIYLNERKGTITLKDKVFNYVSNDAGKLDYDILRFTSLSDSNINAVLNLKNKELEIRGIDVIRMSDSQKVFIQPENGLVRVKQDRNMNFNGKVKAGTLDFFGQDFEFDYQNFKISLPKIDSMKIKVLGEPDVYGNRELIELRTALHDINGDLYIDDSNNKSGLKNYPQYPYFRSDRESFVYYDYPYVQNGVYRRKDFYFKVRPFTIDSLDQLSSTSGIAFPGMLHSGGIFPDFDETLTVQPDTSLGFVTHTPEMGYPAYKGKGRYYNVIRLSDKGLFGNGKLDYLSSVTYSDNFLFMLDSMNSHIQSFDLRRESNNPVTASVESYMHWEPYADSMFVSSKKVHTKMYAGLNNFEGTIVYTPRDLTGDGVSRFENGAVRSNYTVFKPDLFTADTSEVTIYGIDSTKIALKSGNVKSKIDFISRRGDFRTNTDGVMTHFPYNLYATTLPDFTWYFDQRYIEFLAQANKDTSAYSFISEVKSQDSLYFHATNAFYDLNKTEIYIYGVPEILIADAQIIPDSNYVEIYGTAKMKRLTNAKLNANTKTKYHHIEPATIDVFGRKLFNANGYYIYKSSSDSVGQEVYFDRVTVDSTLTTIGHGKIADSIDFKLNPKISYKGDILLRASEKYLTFDGFAKMNHQSQIIASQFFRYKGNVNPDTVMMVINDPRDENKQRLFSGLHIGNLNNEGYSTFISRKIEPNDHDIIKVEGRLIFDDKSQMYKMGDTSKLFGNGLKGNYMTFSDTSETIYAEGKLDLESDFDKKITVNYAGSATDRMGQNDLQVDLTVSIDFVFLPEATNLMLKTVDLNGFDAEGIKVDRPVFEKSLVELFPEKDVKKVFEDIKSTGVYKLPKSMELGMVLTNLQLEWNETRRSWRSVNNKVGIVSIGEKQVNKVFKGYFEVVRKRSGNIINIYFEVSPSDWYYYTYRNGQMEAISSDDEFNKILMEKTKGNSPFSISAMKRKLDFVRSFNN